MQFSNIYILIFFLLFSNQGVVSGQSNVTAIFNRFSIKNGLSSSNISKVIQDKKGFIWVPSQDGLFRFNGTNFSYYNTSLLSIRNSLTGSVIRDLLIQDNTLWVVNALGGIDAIDTNTGDIIFQHKENGENGNDKIIWLSVGFQSNTFFFGTNQGLYELEKGTEIIRKIELSYKGKSNNYYINKLAVDKNKLWIFCNGAGIGLVDAKTKRLINFYQDTLVNYYDYQQMESGSILAGTNKGLRLYKSTPSGIICTDSPYKCIEHIKEAVFAVKKDKEGNIFLAIRNKLIRVNILKNYFDEIKEDNTKNSESWLNNSYGIFFDSQNRIWIGTQDGLLYANLKPSGIRSYSISANSNDAISHSYFLKPTNDSTLFVCAKDGLYQANILSQSITNVCKGQSYFYVFKTPNEKLIVSNEIGSFILNGKRLQPIHLEFPELKPMEKLVLNSHIEISDSVYLFGTQNKRGIILWNKTTKTTQLINTSSLGLKLKDDIVNAVYKDRSENIWILGDNSISRYNYKNKKIDAFNIFNKKTGITFGVYFDICEIGDKFYISSYENGILVVNRQHELLYQFTTKQGLSNNCVYKLLPYKDSLLLATTNNGLNVINLKNGKIKNFYGTDGLHSSEFEEFSGNIYKNLIFAGGKGGFSVIDPSLFMENKMAPTLYMDKITLKSQDESRDTLNTELNLLHIPYNTLQTTISFSALNYSNPTRTTYAYQIKELHKTFLPLGTQNFINLIGLSPGTYTLQVKAANEDGVWCEPKTLILILEPKWYQTLWFKILLVAAGIAIGYGMYRYRLNQLKREESIRTRIAADLHDDIGSTLTSVRIFTDLGLAKNSTEYFPQIRAGIQEASSSLRDIIWVLDKTNNNAKQLLERVAKFALPLTVARQIDFRLIEDENLENIELGTELRRDLYLVMKEFITNSLKYSQCQQITLTARKQNKQLYLLLKDDGIGFDPATIGRGNGLNNMVTRATNAGYIANLTSQIGEGSSLELLPKG